METYRLIRKASDDLKSALRRLYPNLRLCTHPTCLQERDLDSSEESQCIYYLVTAPDAADARLPEGGRSRYTDRMC
jgi:hypothetical protein